MRSYHPAEIPKIWIFFYCAQWKKSNFRNFCWMIRKQPISFLKLFLLYLISSYKTHGYYFFFQSISLKGQRSQYAVHPSEYKVKCSRTISQTDKNVAKKSWKLKLFHFNRTIFCIHATDKTVKSDVCILLLPICK